MRRVMLTIGVIVVAVPVAFALIGIVSRVSIEGYSCGTVYNPDSSEAAEMRDRAMADDSEPGSPIYELTVAQIRLANALDEECPDARTDRLKRVGIWGLVALVGAGTVMFAALMTRSSEAA